MKIVPSDVSLIGGKMVGREDCRLHLKNSVLAGLM